jgi:hypothetical protein
MVEDYTLETRGSVKSLSKVWSRPSGTRIIIVVDDHIISVPNHLNSVVAHTYRVPAKSMLHEVGVCAARWPDTRAIGYFWMPDTDDAISNYLVPGISGWVDSLAGQGCSVFVLIDFLFGLNERPVGPNVYRALRGVLSNARFAFMTQAGGMGMGSKQEKDSPANVFEKVELARYYHSEGCLPLEMMAWLEAARYHPAKTKRASQIAPDQWLKMRRSATASAKELWMANKGTLNHEFWVWHLPAGGCESGHPAYGECFQAMRRKLVEVENALADFPLYEWNIGPCRSLPSWEQPPVRALAQLSKEARDLSLCLSFGKEWVEEIIGSSLDLKVSGLTNDYLWFNAPALVEGLKILAENLSHIARALPDGTGGVVPRGRIVVAIEEFREVEKMGVRVQIREYIDMPDRDTRGILLPASPSIKLRPAYELFARTGGKVEVTDGILTIEICAREWIGSDGRLVWEVDPCP